MIRVSVNKPFALGPHFETPMQHSLCFHKFQPMCPWVEAITTINRNSNIFIQENVIENVVFEMASILSRPQCGNMAGSPDQWRERLREYQTQ